MDVDELWVKFSAKFDNIESGLQHMNSHAKETEGTFKTLQETIKTVMEVLAVREIIEWGKEFVEAGETSEKAWAKVRQTVENAGFSWDAIGPKIEDYSQKMEKLGFKQDETAVSLSHALNVTHDWNNAMTLNGAAMDVARYKGIDLQTATLAVTRAYEGNTRMLKEFGIEVKAGTKGMEVINDVMSKVKGTAASMATPLDEAGAKSADLGIAIGKFLLPAVNAVVPLWNELVTGIISVLNPSDEMRDRMNAIASTVKLVATIIGVSLVTWAFGMLIVSLPAIIAGIADLGVGFVLWSMYAWDAVVATVAAVAPVLGIGIAVLAGVAAVGALIQSWQSLWNAVKVVWGAIGDVINSEVTNLMNLFKALGEIIWGALTLDKDKIKQGMEDAKNAVVGFIGDVINAADKSVKAVASAATDVWNNVKKDAQAAADFMKNLIGGKTFTKKPGEKGPADSTGATDPAAVIPTYANLKKATDEIIKNNDELTAQAVSQLEYAKQLAGLENDVNKAKKDQLDIDKKIADRKLEGLNSDLDALEALRTQANLETDAIKRAEDLAEIDNKELKIKNDQLKITQDLTIEQKKYAKEVNDAWTNTIMSMIKGQTTWADLWQQACDKALQSFIEMLVEMAAKSAAQGLMNFFGGLIGIGSYSQGGTVPAAAGGMIVGSPSKRMTPSSFGSDSVLTALTPDEMVLDKDISAGLQHLIKNGGGDTYIDQSQTNVNAIDTQSFKQALSNPANAEVIKGHNSRNMKKFGTTS